ncbi:hypothetical protein [Azospirillum agricola]|uniref:hypothetical protein n=1 Tax=Azospirillum agricola TaxID=1720247 RepID=UPI000A0F21FB|nr:hypothetical protein [Azospirillum agricola]SMH58836.1 hypothetical protein SAMN02982994_4791 [Azospirillum lipoferum]
MNSKLCLAVIAATLAAAPAAMAQSGMPTTTGIAPTYDSNGALRAPTPDSTGASGRTDAPAVRSLSENDQWQGQGSSRPNRGMNRQAMDQDTMHRRDAMQHQDRMHQRAMSGSTGNAAMNRDATGSSNRTSMRGTAMNSEISSRRGRGQNDLELSQTTLLNQFSAAGYTMVRDFRKDGDRYVAQAQDRDGRWSSVELDPRAGTVTPR